MSKKPQPATLPATDEHAEYDTGPTSSETSLDQHPDPLEHPDQFKQELALQMDRKLEHMQAHLSMQFSEMPVYVVSTIHNAPRSTVAIGSYGFVFSDFCG
jgi:hypothetical protein